MMITFAEFINNISVIDGHWIYPTGTNTVLYRGKKTYIMKAIFHYYEKVWDGASYRSCGNHLCVNPNHLMNKEEHFWSHVDIKHGKEIDKCWEWKSGSDYGGTRHNGKYCGSHQMAWIYSFGEIPEGMYVCHKCDNPPCCNPNHLFLGTRQDNVDDRERKCRNKMPHSKGEEHGHHKLTEKDVHEIRKLRNEHGYSYGILSRKFGVTSGQIRNVIKGRAWGWLE